MGETSPVLGSRSDEQGLCRVSTRRERAPHLGSPCSAPWTVSGKTLSHFNEIGFPLSIVARAPIPTRARGPTATV